MCVDQSDCCLKSNSLGKGQEKDLGFRSRFRSNFGECKRGGGDACGNGGDCGDDVDGR